jgi:hypothetical protein
MRHTFDVPHAAHRLETPPPLPRTSLAPPDFQALHVRLAGAPASSVDARPGECTETHGRTKSWGHPQTPPPARCLAPRKSRIRGATTAARPRMQHPAPPGRVGAAHSHRWMPVALQRHSAPLGALSAASPAPCAAAHHCWSLLVAPGWPVDTPAASLPGRAGCVAAPDTLFQSPASPLGPPSPVQLRQAALVNSPSLSAHARCVALLVLR